jgi:hypothetical protein
MEEKSRQIEWQMKIQGRFYGELQKALQIKECGEATGCGGGKRARKGGRNVSWPHNTRISSIAASSSRALHPSDGWIALRLCAA